MNYIDLFHGIGGFALGAYWAGMKFENHFCSDIEKYCQKLYKLRFPESIQLGDITKIDTNELKKYGDDWIMTGGFPCQDISIAGKGEGIYGKRSGLWFEYWRLINDLRPRFAIMENVGMLIHRGLREVLGSLAEIGYNAEWQDIRAEDMGAPHKRERIWIVAYAMSTGKRRDEWENEIEKGIQNNNSEISDTGGNGYKKAKQNEYNRKESIGKKQIRAGTEGLCSEIPNNNGQRREKQHNGITAGKGNFNGCDAERKNYWSTEPAVGRLANGIPRRVDRLKGLGNAIVPQIAEILFRQIKNI